jgi:glycosyltransferase involved in cell wall biosynthesis
MLHLVVNCGPAEDYIERCIDSIRSQTLQVWQAHVTIDPCGDETFRRALAARGGDRRIGIRCNGTRRYAMFNLIQAIRHSGAAEDDIIAVLDGDDWFATRDALRTIDATYRRHDCWMTYGSWISDSPAMEGMWPAYPDGVEDLRRHEWLGTAVRTWKRWLWEWIEDADLRDASGSYYRVTEDQAVMLPMLEMSGLDRARHIPEALMVYNRTSPFACSRTMREEMHANERHIRSRTPYQRLGGAGARSVSDASAKRYGHSAV